MSDVTTEQMLRLLLPTIWKGQGYDADDMDIDKVIVNAEELVNKELEKLQRKLTYEELSQLLRDMFPKIEGFSGEDFINMADNAEERVRSMYLKIVVRKENYKELAQAIVDAGVDFQWGVQNVYTKVSPLAPDAEFEGQ